MLRRQLSRPIGPRWLIPVFFASPVARVRPVHNERPRNVYLSKTSHAAPLRPFRGSSRAVVGGVCALVLAIIHMPAFAMLCGNSQPVPETQKTINIRAVGDIVLGTNWPEPDKHIPPDVEHRYFAGIGDLLSSGDVVFGNLEGTMTDAGASTKKTGKGTQFAFRMPPRFAGILSDAGFTVLNIANNHTSDFGAAGLEDTVEAIRSHGMFAVGLPNDIVYQEVKGVRIAWIGFSYLGIHNSIHDLGELERLVHQARRYAKIVIVTFHGGAEGSDALRVVDDQEMYLGEKRGNPVRFARTAVDAGADLVLGHGPHVLRGVECYRNKLIVYSLGNFVGYQAFSTKRAAAISMILDVTFDQDGQLRGVQFHPIRFTGENLPVTDPRRRALYLLNDLSQKPPLQNEGTVLTGPLDGDRAYQAYQRWLRSEDLESQLIP